MGLENKTVSFIQTAHNPFILCKNVDRPIWETVYLGGSLFSWNGVALQHPPWSLTIRYHCSAKKDLQIGDVIIAAFARITLSIHRVNWRSWTIIMMLQIVVVLACLALTLGFNFGNLPRVARNVKFTSLQMSTPEAPAGSYHYLNLWRWLHLERCVFDSILRYYSTK